MYFPHAFQKTLIASHVNTPFLDGSTAATSLDLEAGQLGILGQSGTNLIDTTTLNTYTDVPLFYLTQGSFRTSDSLGNSLHGGYTESVKSKGINPKYISKIYRVEADEAQSQVIQITPGVNCTSIECDTSYSLRVDIKGSPVLRTLIRNDYVEAYYNTGCCATPAVNIDPNELNLGWVDYINEDALMSNFIQATAWNIFVEDSAGATTDGSTTLTLADTTGVLEGDMVIGDGIPTNTYVLSITNGTTLEMTQAAIVTGSGVTIKVYTPITSDTYVASATPAVNDGFITITSAYEDTTFGNCSFDPKDFHEKAPIRIYASVYSKGVCITNCYTTNELQAGISGKGYGETIIRELVLDKRYRQEDFKTDPRLREALGDTTLDEISRGIKYNALYILHSIPRKSNPSGVLDSDQYLVKIVYPSTTTGADLVSLEALQGWITTLMASAGNELVTAGNIFPELD